MPAVFIVAFGAALHHGLPRPLPGATPPSCPGVAHPVARPPLRGPQRSRLIGVSVGLLRAPPHIRRLSASTAAIVPIPSYPIPPQQCQSASGHTSGVGDHMVFAQKFAGTAPTRFPTI